jgi:hypothetical protein
MPQGRVRAIVAGVAVVGGLILIVVGVAGALGDWGTTTKGSAAKATAATGTAAKPPSGPAAQPTNGETPQQFLDKLAQAVRDGDVNFQLDRLNEATISRYGKDACRTELGTRTDPTRRYTVKSVSPQKQPYDYASDRQSVTIPDTTTVEADVVTQGQTQPVTLHLVEKNGRFTYLTDCGTPRA